MRTYENTGSPFWGIAQAVLTALGIDRIRIQSMTSSCSFMKICLRAVAFKKLASRYFELNFDLFQCYSVFIVIELLTHTCLEK